jgi:hypothetical protein
MTGRLTEPTVLVGGTADRPLSSLDPSLPARIVGILERDGVATIALLTEAAAPNFSTSAASAQPPWRRSAPSSPRSPTPIRSG